MSIQDNEFELRFAVAEKIAPISSLNSFRTGAYRHVFKRALDLTLVLLSVPITLPVVFLLAVIVARDGKHPSYRQTRVGKHGRIFTMWKLRMMVCDADARLENHLLNNHAARQEWDKKQKLSYDPRITAFGQLLRKSSMDELPQLWNVLIGI